MRRIVIVGSTGSIGTQALEVIERSPGLELAGLAAATSWETLLEQAARFGVQRLALADADAAARASERWTGGEVLAGPEGLVGLITEGDCDLVLNALVGSAGLGPTVAALGEGIDLALANKESLVVGGELVMALAEATGAQLIPVDSEHSALHQLIEGEHPGTVERLVLTASGGPFRGRTDLDDVTPEQALAHPTWDMGGKITIDSATLMNKGLELIEAHHLFGVPYERIDVVVHPQSIVHALVHLNDGASLAHLGYPDMQVPISYALHYPERADVPVPTLDLAAGRRAQLRGARRRHLRLPAPGPRGGRGRRYGPVRAQRRQRGGRLRVPARRAAVHGHRAHDRGHAGRAAGTAAASLLRPLPGRLRGPRDRPRGGCVSWFLAFVGFALLVILHELGHFTAAKAVGMRVEKFSLFFPPTLLKKKVGETEYAVGAIPAGGYVKISGMNPAEELPDEVRTRAYYAQPVWKRIVVISAGPLVNLVLAFLLLFVFFWLIGPQEIGVTKVEKGYPAAGQLQPGDQVLAVDGKRGNPDELPELIASHRCEQKPPVKGCNATGPAELLVKRDGRELTLSLTPVYDPKAKRTRVGFQQGELDQRQDLAFGSALDLTADRFWFITTATLELPARLIDPEQRKEISGVVGSYEVTRQTILTDLEEVVGILAIISLSLAIVNLFPFLPLDGGHIFWAIVEKIRRKPVPFSVMERASVVGFMLVILIFLVGLSNDIDRLAGEGFQVR